MVTNADCGDRRAGLASKLMIKLKTYVKLPLMALLMGGGSLLVASCYDYMIPRHPHGAPPGQKKKFYDNKKGHPHGGPPGQTKKYRY